jgi:long-chain acyl-CoA synthetase
MLLNRSKKTAFKEFDAITHLGQLITEILPGYGKRTALRYDRGDGYQALDFQHYHDNARRLVRLLACVGHDRQQVVATLTRNRPEWDALAHACLYSGNILFPLDTKMNTVELEHLLRLGRPDLLLVPQAQLARVRELLAGLELSPTLLVADAYACHEDQGVAPLPVVDGEISLAEWFDQPAPTSLPGPSPRLDDPDMPLAYYATSGTTSLPKVVVISNSNIIAEVNEGIDVLNLRPNEEVLNIGPRTHIATLVEFLVTTVRGFPVTYFTREPDEDGVLEAEIAKLKAQGVRIKGLMAVPKFWIVILKDLLEELNNKPLMRSLYRHLIAIEKHDGLTDIGTLDKAKLAAVRNQLRGKLGGYFSIGISSSAKLDGALVEIFGKLGITLIDVYGATEACGIISRNRLDDLHPGTCGRLIAGLEYRVLDPHRIPGVAEPVGELCIKGPTVALGYLGQSLGSHLDEQGFFNTGDLAWVDDHRIVHLVGRGRELLHWDDGRLVDPMQLSNLLVRSVFVKDALVTRLDPGDDTLSVFLYPDHKRIDADPEWRAERSTGVSEAQALRRRLVQAIDYAQSIVGPLPRLGTERIYLLPRPLERTPTHKIKLLFELQRLDRGCFV